MTRLQHKHYFSDEVQATWRIPSTIEELAHIVRTHSQLSIGNGSPYDLIQSSRLQRDGKDGSGVYVPYKYDEEHKRHPLTPSVLLDRMNQIVDFSPQDQLVKVESGAFLSDVNEFLSHSNYEIPAGLREEDQEASIGDMVALNLPHWNMAKGGSWRDWIVKMKVVLASGEVVISGADVVKNVTGFDLHKLMIGARSTLGVIAEVTLRIKPVSERREYPPILLQHGELVVASPSNFKAICARLQPEADKGSLEWYCDEASGLILAEQTRLFEDIPHFAWRSHVYENALQEFSETEKKLMRRTKEIFDPTNKLNTGEFGFI